ncbi:MAG: histidine kinase [Clostridiales bacterium]|jgi:two-component system sensor histidine kinase YesM|nr:histidine kinase [Clostridiales bacterium]
MKRLINSLDDISIRRKFLIVYIFCVCLPLIVSGIIWMGFTSRAMSENTTHYFEQTFNDAGSDFNILMQTSINIGTQVSADKSILNDLSQTFQNAAEHYDIYWNRLRSRFSMYLTSNPDIAAITLYIDDPHFINCDYFRVIDDSVRRSKWYQSASQLEDNTTIYPGPTSITILPHENRITLIRKIRDPKYLSNATNYLLIELKLDHVIDKISQETETMRSYLTCFGDQILWSSPYVHKAQDGAMPLLELPDNKKYYILQIEIGPRPIFDGWKITGVYDSSQIYSKQLVVLLYILVITALLSALSVLLIRFLLNSLRRRLSRLSAHMKDVGDSHFTALDLENPGQDEVGFLIIAFNDMITKINDLINDVYKLEMQKKTTEMENMRAEYKYLQAQVDPHFLFNTLNAILVFCVKNGYAELSDIISSLSKMMKRLLSGGDDLVPVVQEMDFIGKYLAIEKFRFGSRFQYSIEISPEVKEHNAMIPKMSIQPLVENACKHGLQSIPGNRMLLVRAEMDVSENGRNLVISVTDNGSGMNEKTVDAVHATLARDGWTGGRDGSEHSLKEAQSLAEPSESGIGLQNVYRRMKMYYGDKFHFSLKSAKEQGTSVVMRIED